MSIFYRGRAKIQLRKDTVLFTEDWPVPLIASSYCSFNKQTVSVQIMKIFTPVKTVTSNIRSMVYFLPCLTGSKATLYSKVMKELTDLRYI